jgi:O-antigen/teichoic acid export membrane protein
MSQALRRVRGAVGMGLVWAIGGAGVGGLIELLDNVVPAAHGFTRQVDMWPQVLAIPSFMLGVLFAVVLGIVGARRRFDQLSVPQFAGWGAMAGLLLGLWPVSNGAPIYALAITSLWSAIAAASSLALARRAEDRELLAAGEGVAGAGLSEREARELLGRGD